MLLFRSIIILFFILVPCVAQDEPQQKTIEVTVFPRLLNESSYGHKLLPEEVDLKDGDAAVVLLRMIYEQDNYMRLIAPKFSEWLELPFDDPDAINGIHFDHFYGQLKRAAFFRDCDWNYPIDEDVSRIAILLPDAQTGRVFVGRGLPLFIRKQVAEENPAKAQEAIMVGLACSRHYARTPFVVCGLIGIACSSKVLEQADLLIQMEGAENLFWAYEKLPQPLIPLRRSASLETELVEKTIPKLRQRPWPGHDEEGEWMEIGNQIVSMWAFNFGNRLNALESAAKLEKFLKYLKDNWATLGDSETQDKVTEMSPPEFGCRFFIHKSKQLAQKFEVACTMNPKEALKLLVESSNELKELAEKMDVPEIEELFLNPLGPYVSSWRDSRKIVALQTIEAIRHFAAMNDGRLPKTLDEIDLPLPVDPFTEKPLAYKLGDDAATLIMPNPGILVQNLKGTERFEYKYRVRIAPLK